MAAIRVNRKPNRRRRLRSRSAIPKPISTWNQQLDQRSLSPKSGIKSFNF
ncbi:hypothetical protein [Nostoc sp. ChiQUE01b]|nr:hypothetical protein [Nostoc sp. ChiQUE01b]MDZ8257644.1 hypothetical protein [Nostoc sp. ChiQUE01b]